MLFGINENPVHRAGRSLLLCFALLILAVGGGESRAQAPLKPLNFQADRLLLLPKPSKAADAANLHRRKGRKVLKTFSRINNLQVLQLAPGEDVLAAVKEYNASGAVEFAEPDYLMRPHSTANDPLAVWQWHLNNYNNADIDAPEAWNIRREAPNVIVAIIDSGMRLTHEDLAPNLWRNNGEIPGNGIDDDGDGYVDDVNGIDAIVGNGNPTDTVGHGTHVAGIIGAVGNNERGIAGVAWKVQLMPLRFITLDNRGDATGTTSDAIECVNYAIRHGAGVINASFGSAEFSYAFQFAIQSARTAGIVFCASAGNDKLNNDVVPNYPANFALDNIISVAATTSSDAFDSTYSNYGATTVDIGAPGTYIYSTGYSSDYDYVTMSGTSMAAPIVSGVMALLKAQYPNHTPAQLIQRVLATADPLSSLKGKCVSGGRINLQRALASFVSADFVPSTSVGSFPLKVNFSNTAIGDVAEYLWSFGDGSEVSTEKNPSHVFASEGNFTVTLAVRDGEGHTSARAFGITVLPPYNYRSVAYEWIEPTNATRLFLTDNGVTAAQNLPFSFYFYGDEKSEIYIGANGLMGFDLTNMTTTVNADIPSAVSPNGCIMPYWDNLDPSSGGFIAVGSVGQSPNRQFVVSWVDVPRNSSLADRMTFQAVLNETTGRIQFNYLQVQPGSVRGGGARATIGVEDASGLVATKYCFDGAPNRVANGQSIGFFSVNSGGLIVTPDSPNDFFGTSAALQTNNVAFTLSNTSRVPLLWSARKGEDWLSLSGVSGVLPPGAQTTINAQVNKEAAALNAGSHKDMLTFVNLNNGNGDTTRAISLEVNAALAAHSFKNGLFELELPGAPGQTFILEASTNLVDWFEIQRGQITAEGTIPFIDKTTDHSERFFRAQILP